MWDPGQYLRFGDERSRPFFDLTARIGAAEPGLVVDLGCGPGQLTEALADRWPGADVLGVDASQEMIAAARPRERPGKLTFTLGDLRDWSPQRPPNVIVSNAVLQWVPGHDELLTRWAAGLAPGGWLAIQVPANYDQPNHVILRELAASADWRDALAGVQLTRQGGDPAHYLDLLAGAGCAVDAWETTYQHVLAGPDPVVEWFKGSGLRPVLTALSPERAAKFLDAYAARVKSAYPTRPYGTVLPFRRVFAVARRGPG
jgi:trans-aconitate 2-methyltransferase